MIKMRYLAVLTCCLWANSVVCSPLPDHNTPQDYAQAKSENARTKRSTDESSDAAQRDYDFESIVFAKLILRELARELRNEKLATRADPPRNAPYSDDGSDVIVKRKPFWQAMGGPLPVETRLASFGTKIIPDASSNSPNRFKGMRYGRR